MAITHAIAHAEPGTHEPPASLLRHLDARLSRSYTRNGTFITAFSAVLDPAARTLTYARAGHNPPRLLRGGRVIALDSVGGMPLGILGEQPYGETTVTLERGDLLVLYTDGVTETRAKPDAAGEHAMFGVERLDALLLTCDGCPPVVCIPRIRTALAEFSDNAAPVDDQTLIAIRCG